MNGQSLLPSLSDCFCLFHPPFLLPFLPLGKAISLKRR